MSSTAVDMNWETKMTSSGDTIAVHFDAVLKRFGEVVALHEISLPIRRGEFMTLLALRVAEKRHCSIWWPGSSAR